MQKQGEKDGAAPPPSVQQDEIFMDSDDDRATKDSSSSHDLKRLKKSAAVLEDEGYDFKDDDDSSSFNNCNNGSGSDKRSTGKGDSGMGHASIGREHGSGEIAPKQRSRHDRSQSCQSYRSNSSGSRHRSTPSSSSSNNHSKRKRNGDSKESWSSRSRSRSRSKSNSPTSERRPFLTYFEQLKAEWGKEPWQDFELLQNNVLGPGSKGSVGPGATPTLTMRTDDLDNEVDDRCNCSPVGSPTAPTCYDSSCHNFATMQECRAEKCHPGCKNQRIQRRENSNVQVFDAEGKGMGLRLVEPAAKGQFIAEYVGEIITRKELNKRMISSAGTRKLYMMQLGDNTYLDAKRKGGIARFVNHSCEPTCRLEQWTARGQPRCAVFTLRALKAGEELSFDYQWEAHELREATKCLCGTPSCRGTIEVLNPNAESGGGPFARGRVKASAMGVWRTPNEGEYANPEGLIGRRVRVYFDGDCTYFEAKVMRYKAETKTHMLLYAGEGDSVNDELEEDLIGVQGKIQGIDKWQIWEESDRVVNIKKKDTNDTASAARTTAVSNVPQGNSLTKGMPVNKWKSFPNRFRSPLQHQLQPGMGMGMAMAMGPSGGFPGMMPGPPMTLRPPPPHPPPLPPPVGPRVAEEFLVPSKDTEQVRSDSEIVQTVKGKTSVHLELLETDDPRAAECPAGQRLLRVAGGRDQVNMAVDMLRSKVLSLRPLEEWLAAERRRKAQEAAETKGLEADAKAQVNRVRQRWCIGSDWHCFSKAVISLVANNKNVADLRRNALHVVRQVAESGAGKISNPAPLIFHASILIHRYLAIINVPNVSSAAASSEVSSSTASTSNNSTTTNANTNGSSKTASNKLVAGSSSSVKDSAGSSKDTGGSTNGSAAISNGSSGASSSVGAGATAGRFQMETNFYVLATACLLLANKSLRTRVGSSRPRRREELLRSAYGVQFRGRAVERGTAEAIKWEGKLAAAELEVLTALGFDVHITDPLEVLDQQRVQKFISSACHSKASSLVVESVTQGCTAWLRFEPDVVALSVLLLAIGTTATREELITRAQTLAVNAGGTWPAVLACTQSLARSLPSLASEESDEGEEGPAKIAAALRQVPAADPMQYPDYEPPLMAAQKRLRQRRRAEDSVFDAKLRTTDLLMMRKAQDRAGLHGGLGGLQGIKGLAGFGSTLASNKFVRAAIREEDLLSAGLECIVPYLEPWKGFTMTAPLAGVGGGNVLEVYLQRWPADKKEGDSGGCGLSSSGMSELALFQELHSYSAVTTGHDTLLVPLAVVMGAGMKPTGKLGASRSPQDRVSGSKLNGKASDIMEGEGQTPTAIGINTRMDPLSPLGTGGLVSVSMALGSDQRSLGGAGASLGADMDPSFASGGAVGSIAGAVGSDGEGERAGASQIPDELLSPSYLLLEPVRYTLAEILRLCRRPMVLPGPLVKSMLQDLLGAVALCHDRNIVIKSIDAEKVYLDQRGRLKLGCLAQAMMVSPKDKETAASQRDKSRQDAASNGIEADDMEVEDTPEGRKAAHREGKLKMKQEKLARDNVCKKAVAAMLKEGEPSKTVLWAMAPEVMVDQKQPHSPATDIWAVGCLAAQLALGKPIFGGRTRKQQLEYVFKCCGSPGQGRWPDGNKAPLYRHLRPVDKDGKSLHFKPRLEKVLAAEGHKGVPLDPGLAALLQGLLKLDARHRFSAREALASPYFAPIPGLREEINDAWFNLRGDLDKVQMGVATPDQLRGTYAAANAPAGPPKPTPPPISSQVASRDMDDPSDSYGYSSPILDGQGDLSEEAMVLEGRNGHDEKRERMNRTERDSHGSVHLPLEPDGGVERHDPMTIDSGFESTSGGLGGDRPRGEDGKMRHQKGGASRSWSPRSGGHRGRSPDNDRGLRDSHRERQRDWGTERARGRDMDREMFKDKERKRKRERDRQRERQRKRERSDVRPRDHGRLSERSGKEAWRRDDGDGERERWGGRGGRF